MKSLLSKLRALFCIATLAAVASVAPASASNGKIVFSSQRNGAGIWVMNPDGTSATSLISNVGLNFNDPVWSPDGTKIAYTSNTPHGEILSGSTGIFVMNADGTNVKSLTNDAFNNMEPTWSPDGTKIAFAANRDGNVTSIYSINFDGTGLTRVTNPPASNRYSDQAPAWSPDGSKIAFWTNEAAIGLHIAVVNADGTGRTTPGCPVVPGCLTPVLGMNPAWSPDGNRIAYSGWSNSKPWIFVMNAVGTGQTQLTSGAVLDDRPAWSPDGTQITFERNLAGQLGIFVMNADGSGQPHPTNNNASGDGAPDWQNVLFTPPGYLGCYTDDSSNRALPLLLSSGNETAVTCKQKAAAAGYPYAGIQNYGECWAGDLVGYSVVPDDQCNTLCTADKSERCGGALRNSIYAAPVPPNRSRFISQSVPSSMLAGGTYDVSITMTNTGTNTWTTPTSYNLGSQNPQDNLTWGFGRVPLPASTAPYSQAPFLFHVTAPKTPGLYNFQWRMVQDGVEWFGDYTPNVIVTIVHPPLGYLGCYTDASNPALPSLLSSGNETVESCKQKASVAGYSYAGLQNHGECWGGDSLGYTKVPDGQCNTPCTANPNELCGGVLRNSIYVAPICVPRSFGKPSPCN